MTKDFSVSNAGISAAFEFITQQVQSHGLNETIAHRLSVILDELCSNMIRHDSTLTEASRFTLELEPLSESVRLSISDPGIAFNPLEHQHDTMPEIGGHGISLVKGLSSDVRYERREDRNVITVVVDADD